MENLNTLLTTMDRCINDLEHLYYETVERFPFPRIAGQILIALKALREARFALFMEWLKTAGGKR